MKTIDFGVIAAHDSGKDQRREQESRSFTQGDTDEFKSMSQTEHFELVLARIEAERKDLTADEEDWSKILLGIATTFGEQGRDYAHRISQFWCKAGRSYDPHEVDDKFDWCLSNGKGSITIATVIQIAKDYGVDVSMPYGRYPEGAEPPRLRKVGRPKAVAAGKTSRRKKGVIEVFEYLKSRFEFRYNLISEDVEYIYADDSAPSWKPVDERITDTILTELHSLDIMISRCNLASYIGSEGIAPEYNPGKEYLSNLPEWDPSQPDYIGQLFDHIQMENADGLNSLRVKFLKKWFLCMTANINGDGKENQLVPNLRGRQGTGKTFLAKHFLPPVLRGDYCTTITPGGIWSKDEMMLLNSNYLVILDEWEADKKSNEFFKSIISLDKTKVRSPYARRAKTRHRVASFIANGNNEICLIDPQGSRRFITCTVRSTTNLNENPLPLDGAYAQALYLISQPGYQHSLTQDEIAEIDQLNQDYIAADVIKEAIQSIYKVPCKNELGIWVSTADVKERLSYKLRGYEVSSADIGRRMKELGFLRKHPQNRSQYYVLNIGNDYNNQCVLDGERFFYEQRRKREAENVANDAKENLF